MDNTTVEPQPPSLSEVANRLREDMSMLMGAIDRERSALEKRVRTMVDQHPALSIAGAFGVGYLLGGGLFSRRTLPLLGFAARYAASELLGRVMTQVDDGSQAVPR